MSSWRGDRVVVDVFATLIVAVVASNGRLTTEIEQMQEAAAAGQQEYSAAAAVARDLDPTSSLSVVNNPSMLAGADSGAASGAASAASAASAGSASAASSGSAASGSAASGAAAAADMGVPTGYNPYAYAPAYGDGYTPAYSHQGFHMLGGLIIFSLILLVAFVGYQKFFQNESRGQPQYYPSQPQQRYSGQHDYRPASGNVVSYDA